MLCTRRKTREMQIPGSQWHDNACEPITILRMTPKEI